MAQDDTGTARASARSSAAKPGTQANDQANDRAAAEVRVAEAVAKALGEQFSGAIREVFSEQREIFAEQASLREADYVLVREMVEEQRERRQKDAELLRKIDKQAETHPEPFNARRIDAEPGQLRLGLQFNALSNVLGSRKRTRASRDDSLIPPPEITRVTTGGKPGFRMTFVAPLPAGAATVGVQYLDDNPKDLVRVGSLAGNSLEVASDQVQFVELLDGRALPIAFGIPYRR